MHELKREKLGGRLKGTILGLLAAALALLLLPAGASAAAATHFSVTAPASATAGSQFSFTVTALDSGNATDTTYAGTVHLTSSDGQAVLPANTGLTNGVGTFQATLKTAGNQTITATDAVTTSITGTSGSINVSHIAADHFTVSAPASVTAGSPFSFTVTARDPFGNTDTGYAPSVHFSSSDTSGTLPVNSTLSSGVGTFGATLRKAGAQTITAAQVANLSITGTSSSIAVAAAPATHLAVATPAAAQTGTGFGFTVTALDDFGNTDPSARTVHFTSGDGAATLPANSPLTSGSGTFTATLRTEGIQTLSANDAGTPSINGTSAGIAVSSATHFTVTAPAIATAGEAFTFTVTARNASGAVDTAYGGSVRFSSSDASASLPIDSKLSNGTGTFTATLRTGGSTTITAIDRDIPSVSGGSGVISVSPSNAFSFAKLKLHKHSGTATLSVEVPGPGKLALGGKGIRPQRAAPGAAGPRARGVSEAGTVRLTVKARGKAKKKLNQTGKVKVKAKVTFTPTGGAALTHTIPVKLQK